jgi:tRNA A37 threonylcarbamoyladenosine modification protein TsaB
MIDAKRDEVYAAVYERGSERFAIGAAVAPCAESPRVFLEALQVQPDAFVGTGALVHRDVIMARFPGTEIAAESRALPSTAYFASIAHLLPVFTRDMVRVLEPVYVRPSGAERVRLRTHTRAPEKDNNG